MIPRAVLPALLGLVLALPFAATEARAQAPAAAELHVVVLATVPTMAERPTAPIPAAFRENSLYWRVLKSGDAVAYQLCLGFFETRNDAERARKQLAADFREARVIQVSPRERENLQKAAQTPTAALSSTVATRSLLQQADTAYSAGERDLAKSLYQSVLASDPDNSRAVFQLARLSPPGSAEPVALLRRYVKLEPQDAWGWMALGDALAKSGKVDEAIGQYAIARRLAPAESDVYVGLGRILRDAGRTDELVANDERWVAAQPKNAQAWLELGRARQRAKRYAEAADAYAASYAIRKDERTEEALDGALAESGFSLRPYFGLAYDTDDDRIKRWGLDAEWQLTPRSRWGLHGERAEVWDPVTTGTVDSLAVFAKWQPLSQLRLDALGGTARLTTAQTSENRPLGALRVRWNRPGEGPAVEIRATQNPLIATPELVAQPVELKEIKAGLDAPVDGPIRARARGQLGVLDSAIDVNRRSGYQLGPVYRWRPAAEVGVFYSRLAYDHATAAGYFAPQRAETIELGTYIEYEGWAPLTFAIDAGAGEQRVQKFGEDIRGWIATYRLWGLVSCALKPGVSLDLEVEHYDSPIAGNAVATTANWRYNAATLSLRFGVRPQSTRSFLAERSRGS